LEDKEGGQIPLFDPLMQIYFLVEKWNLTPFLLLTWLDSGRNSIQP